MTRHGGSGSLLDALNLSYSGNRLAAVSHSGGTWSYGHDGSGRMTSDGRLGGIAVQYGETGLPRRTMGPPGSGITTTEYSYLADGTRLGVAQNRGTNSSPTYYGYLNAGSLNVLHNGASVVFESSAYEAGVIYSHGLMYFTRDHLGNTRVVTDGSGNVVERNDYYPFGERHSDSSMPTVNSNRWRFAGKEIQPLGGTGWLDFGARQYDSFLGRWTTVDPLAEKYPGFSPYSYCAGNPINLVDREGKKIYFAQGSSDTFKRAFSSVVAYMNLKGTADNLAKLESSEEIYYIKQVLDVSETRFSISEKTIYWDPFHLVETDSDFWLSPATVLDHETEHAVIYDRFITGAMTAEEKKEYLSSKKAGSDSQYGSVSEKNVIEGREQATAFKHGEIVLPYKTRKNHNARALGGDVIGKSPLEIEKTIKEHNELFW